MNKTVISDPIGDAIKHLMCYGLFMEQSKMAETARAIYDSAANLEAIASQLAEESVDASRWRAVRDNQGDGLRIIEWDHKATEEMQVMFPSKRLCDEYADAATGAKK